MILDNIHNHYEKLVFEAIQRRLATDGEGEPLAEGALEDIACLALNHLPTRYVRHSVDLVFYLTPDEQASMERQVAAAVAEAFEQVRSHPHAD